MFEKVVTAVTYCVFISAFFGPYVWLIWWSVTNLEGNVAAWMIFLAVLISLPFIWLFGQVIAFASLLTGIATGLLAVIIRALIRWGRRARQKNNPK